MLLLIMGLILFLGMHSVRIVAEDFRTAQISKRGEGAWMGIYSAISLLGFMLIIWGYADARVESPILWNPPIWTKHLAALLTLPAFILFVAAYVPGSKMKAVLGHPMILGTKLWALAHLLSNGAVVDVLLFGGFLLWSVLDFRAARKRTKAAGITFEFAGYSRDAIAIVFGLFVWAVFSMYLHAMWIGVKPFG